MLSIGDGVLLSTLTVTIGGLVFRYIPYKNNKNGSKPVEVKFCPAHSGVEEKLEGLEKGQDRIERNQEEMFRELRIYFKEKV